jgi:hypothetical protein
MVNKGVIVVGSLVVAGGLVFALTRKAAAAPPSGDYCCPYDSSHGCFATYEDLVAHVQSVHPGERIPLPIEWE